MLHPPSPRVESSEVKERAMAPSALHFFCSLPLLPPISFSANPQFISFAWKGGSSLSRGAAKRSPFHRSGERGSEGDSTLLTLKRFHYLYFQESCSVQTALALCVFGAGTVASVRACGSDCLSRSRLFACMIGFQPSGNSSRKAQMAEWMSMAFISRVLEESLPRLADSELRRHPAFYTVSLTGFALGHGVLYALIWILRRIPYSESKLPLLQPGAWPRHGVNRILAMFHGATTFFWACAVMTAEQAFFRSASEPSYLGQGVSELQRPLLLFSCSYFAYDLVYVAWERDVAGILHHATSLAGFLYGIVDQTAGGEYTAALAVAEVSTASLHLRYFARHFAELYRQQRVMKAADWRSKSGSGATKDSHQTPKCLGFEVPLPYTVPGGLRFGRFYISFSFFTIAFEWTFALTFIVARGPCSTLLTLACLRSTKTASAVKVFAITIWALSFFWLRQVLILVYRQLRPADNLSAASLKKKKI